MSVTLCLFSNFHFRGGNWKEIEVFSAYRGYSRLPAPFPISLNFHPISTFFGSSKLIINNIKMT